MASEDSSFDLQSLLADAQDLVDESFVARALLQSETDPWEVRVSCRAIPYQCTDVSILCPEVSFGSPVPNT